jgi:hypothetical protein
MVHSKLAAFAFMLILAAPLHAQTACPPVAEGAVCDHYHYHLSVWNIESHTYDEVAVTRPFVSAAACEKARVQAVRENASFAEFIKTTKIDTSMMPNRFGNCHCDRTQDPSTPAFMNAKQRIVQLRAQQDAIWSLRERLLGQNVPGAGDRLNLLFARPAAADRFLRDTMPPRLPPTAPVRAPVTLIDSTIGSSSATPAIAASLSLVPVIAPPAAPPAAAAQSQPAVPQPAAQSTLVQPPNPQPAPPPNPEPHPPTEVRNR